MSTNPNQILYLLEEAFIGNRSWHEHELVDCQCAKRARALEDKGLGFIVGRAVEYSDHLKELRADGEDDHDIVMFLNRVKMFPFEYRCPEWQSVVAKIWIPPEEDIANFVRDNERPPSTPIEFQLVTLEQAEHMPAGTIELELPPPKPKRPRKKKAMEG